LTAPGARKIASCAFAQPEARRTDNRSMHLAYRRSCGFVAVAASLLLATGAARAGGKAVEGVVNLNTAPPELLAVLPGVGPSKALGIVAYRTRHPFRTVDELVRVKGIGRKMVRAMRDHLAVAGPSTGRGVVALPHAIAAPPPPPAARPPPPVCRSPPPPPPPAAVARAVRIAQNRATIALANHCARPP